MSLYAINIHFVIVYLYNLFPFYFFLVQFFGPMFLNSRAGCSACSIRALADDMVGKYPRVMVVPEAEPERL